jgi:MtrB/PioB family decaheme-associated outer membrane protein
MNKTPLVRPLRARPTLLTLALLAAFGSAQAQVAPAVEGSVSVGIGAVSGDRADRSLFDQYNGLQPSSNLFGIFGADYYRRDDKTGTLARFQGTDLLTGNRELDFLWKRQGDWSFSADYRELRRLDPYIPNTALIGGGATAPQVVPLLGGPGTGGDMDLKIKRTGLGLGFSKVISRQWQFDASLKTENKEGARLFGVGMACPTFVAPGCRGSTGTEAGGAVLMVPEPVDANHSQAEARLSFGGEKLSLSVGYYGSFYRNQFGSLNPNVPGSLYNPLGTVLPLSTGLQAVLNNPVALPPDNQAHQLDVTGAYAFNRTTNLNFKLAYTRATQHQNFADSGFTAGPAGVSDLGGRLSTTLAQVGLNARPMPKLSLNGSLRYEQRDDSTPLALYGLIGAAPNLGTFTNRRYPLTTVRGKVEAGYQFTPEYKGTLAATLHNIDRRSFTDTSAVSGVTALRLKTEETGLRAELRKRMSEVLSGAVSVESSRRDGSNWLRDASGRGVVEVTDTGAAGAAFENGIFPVNLADRRRDKFKVSADWQPSEKLSLQAIAETGRDRFDTPSVYGVRKSRLEQLSLDATYAINDNWNLTGFVSRGQQEVDQVRPGAAFLAFDNTSAMLGFGVNGKVSGKVEVGGNLSYLNDKNVYVQTLEPTADLGSVALLAATGGLPNIVFRQTQLRLFGKYTINKQSSVRVDFMHQRSHWNDWAWNYNGTPFVYSDGTTVNYKTNQNVSFLGVSYVHRWP